MGQRSVENGQEPGARTDEVIGQVISIHQSCGHQPGQRGRSAGFPQRQFVTLLVLWVMTPASKMRGPSLLNVINQLVPNQRSMNEIKKLCHLMFSN